MKVSDVMREMRNYFEKQRIEGRWQAKDGQLIDVDMLLTGDWIAIGGSMHNDGVHQVAEDGSIPTLRNEQWDGTVWLLHPPEDFLALCREIADWCEQHPEDDIKRESFGAYSVEKATLDGVPLGWQHVFAASLRPYHRMWTEVTEA